MEIIIRAVISLVLCEVPWTILPLKGSLKTQTREPKALTRLRI